MYRTASFLIAWSGEYIGWFIALYLWLNATVLGWFSGLMQMHLLLPFAVVLAAAGALALTLEDAAEPAGARLTRISAL